MQVTYECQICKYTTDERPPEWCPKCGGHRAIFKRIIHTEQELILTSA